MLNNYNLGNPNIYELQMEQHIALIILVIFSASAFAKKPLNLAFLSSDTGHVGVVAELSDQFEQLNPDIKVVLNVYSDGAYKQRLLTAMQKGKLDVIYWQTGYRLSSLVEQGKLAAIKNHNTNTNLKQNLPDNFLQKVTYQDALFAVPFAQYSWGFYYNKSLFSELNLSPPKSWKEFIALSQTLKSNNVSPLVLANDREWEALGWIDYLALRFGGETLRQNLIKGPVDGKAIRPLIDVLNFLIQQDLFYTPEHDWNWQQTLTLIKRKKVGMTLLGQFAEESPLLQNDKEIGYFPFPGVASVGAITPTGVFAIPSTSRVPDLAETFLAFVAQEQIQRQFAIQLGWLPVNLNGAEQLKVNERRRTSIKQILEAKTLVDYFDREAEPNWAISVNKALVRSIEKGDINYLRVLLSE